MALSRRDQRHLLDLPDIVYTIADRATMFTALKCGFGARHPTTF